MPAFQTQQFTLANGSTVNLLVTNRNNIPYIELQEGYREQWRRDDVQVTRVCATRWQDRYLWLQDMLGTSFVQAGNNVGGVVTNLSRYPPEGHPFFTDDNDVPWLYAQSAEMVMGVGIPPSDISDLAKALSSSVNYQSATVTDDTNEVAYALAQYSLIYTPLDYTVLEDGDVSTTGNQGELGRYIIRRTNYAADAFNFPGTALKYVDGSATPIPTTASRPNPLEEILYTWKAIPSVPYSAISSAIGKVNNAFFDTNFQNWPPGTLLFVAPEITPYRTSTGQYVYDITYRFQFRNSGTFDVNAKGHNWFPRFDQVNKQIVFQEVSLDGNTNLTNQTDGKSPFNWADFTQLFIVPTS